MARNPKVELRGHEGQVVHPITDGDCVIFPSGETLSHKLSEQEEVMYAPEVTNSSPMFKVGEGDSSDYSANVLDGAYQEAVLKGQTYVNTIQEPSADVITLPTPFTEYERTQSKTFTEMQDGTFGLNLVGQSYVNCIQEPSEPSYVALGEALEFQNKKVEYTTDGQIKSAMLKGQTLVNLADLSNLSQQSLEITKNNNEIILSRGNYTNYPSFKIVIPNGSVDKKYTVIYKCKVNQESHTFGMGFTYNNLSGAWENAHGTNNFTPTTEYKTYSFVSTGHACLSFSSRWTSYPDDGTIIYFKDIIVIEGEYDVNNIDIPYFKGMQSVTMTTELENVCSRYNSSGAKNGKTFTVGTANDRRMILSDSSNIAKYGFKQNMKYLIQFKITNLNLDGEEYIEIIFSDSNVSVGDALFGDYASTAVKITKNGIYRTVLTTSTVIDTSVFIIKGLAEQWEGTSSTTRRLTISQIMCIEYQNGMENWDLPYFEDYQVMKPVQVESTSKNKFNTRNANRVYGCTPTFHNDNSFTLVGSNDKPYKSVGFLINVKPNTEYRLSYSFECISGTTDAFYDVYSADNKYLTHHGNPINTGNNTQLSIRFYVNSDNTKNGTIRYYDIQMEEGATSTDYVPHQSKTISARKSYCPCIGS